LILKQVFDSILLVVTKQDDNFSRKSVKQHDNCS